MNHRRLAAAVVAALPLLGFALLQLPPTVLVTLLVADVGVLGWAVARYPARPARGARVARRPPPRYWDPDTGEILAAPIPWPPSSPPVAAGRSPIAAAPGAAHVQRRTVTARQSEGEQRLTVDHEVARTDSTFRVRAGLGDELRRALGVDEAHDR